MSPTGRSPTGRSPAIGILAWALGATLLVLVLLLASLLVAGNTSGGRLLVERLTARLSSGRIELEGLSGSFPGDLELDALQLRDADGVWLSARRIALRWSPLALLEREVRIEALQVGTLVLDRRPVSRSPAGSPSLDLPRIEVAALRIDTLTLGPELAGIRASLSANGRMHLRSLRDVNVMLSGRRIDGVGTYELSCDLTPARIDAALTLAEPASGPLENLLGLPGLGALSLQAALHGPRSAERIDVALSAGALSGRVAGSVDLDAPAAALSYDFQAPAMTPRPGLAWQSLNLAGHWGGPLVAAAGDGRLQIAALEVPGGWRLAALRAELGARSGTLELHGVAEGLETPGEAPRLLASDAVAFDATWQPKAPDRPLAINVTHRLFSLRAEAVTQGPRSASFQLRLPDLAAFAPLTGFDARGAATFDGKLTRSGSGAPLHTHLALEGGARLAGGGTLVSRALSGPVRLELAAADDASAFEIEHLRVTSPALSLTASGTAPAGSLHARYDLDILDAATLSPTLAGTAHLVGRADGLRTDFAVDSDLTSMLSVRGSPAGKVSASVHVAGLPRAPRGRVTARGVLAGAPLELDVALERSGVAGAHGVIRRAVWRSAHLTADLAGTGLARLRGEARFGVDRLRDLEPLLGEALDGSLAGTLALSPAAGSAAHAELAVEARDVVAGAWSGTLRLSGSGTTDSLPLRLDAQLPRLGGATATLTSTAVLDLPRSALRVQSAQAEWRSLAMRLLAPAQLAWRDGVTLSPFQLGCGPAVLELEGRFLPQLEAQATLRGVQPNLIDAWLPGVFAGGRIDAEARVRGSFLHPSGTLRLDARQMRLAADIVRGAPAVNLDAEAHLLETSAVLDARLEAGKASLVTLKGRAPLDATGALDLKLLGKLDVGLVNPLLEAHGRHAAGVLSVDANVTGTAAAPAIGGTLHLERGDLRDYAQGVHFTDVIATVEGSERSLRLVSFSARAAPGTLSMTGALGLLEPGLPLELELIAHRARPIASNLLTVDLDADLKLRGTLREHLDLTGTVHASRTRIGIPDSLPPDVAVLDVRRAGQKPPEPSVSRLVVGLDLTLQAPNQVLVSGRGLSAELGGDVHIAGTAAEPLVSGGFDLIRGTFSLASSQLTFSSGEVSFNGAGLRSRIDPTLDFTAQSTVLDVTATLKITGLADAPVFSLTSTPELPQDEILARLLFGETASQLTTLQVAEIGVALTSLSGSGSGLNPLVRLQKSLGLDRLAVGGGTSTAGNPTNSGATIEAGRYVSKRVYVGAKQSTTGASQVQVQVDLTKHLKLQSQLGNGTAPVQGTTPENDPGSSVGVSYQFEY